MSDATVYLEDIQVTKKEQKPLATATNAGVKRQRTLQDMFAPGKRQKGADGAAFVPTRFTATKNSQKLNAIPFSLSAFVESLSPDDRALLALECEVMGKSWLKVLKDELTKPYFLALKRFLWTEGVKGAHDPIPPRVYPAPKDIYAWSQTPLGRVKVVILGQDPYPGKGQAHGLAFSVRPGVAVPPSLVNIYKQLASERPTPPPSTSDSPPSSQLSSPTSTTRFPPAHGTLTPWAEQGVLLLNSALTVRANAPNSHADKGWEAFVREVVKAVDRWGGASLGSTGVGEGVVFMAWGANAQDRVKGLNKTKHLVLTSPHPSPRSADRGFFGNNHFTQANQWLEERYGEGSAVDWWAL